VNTVLHLWQEFLALHPWGYVITAVVALVALIKRKAIGAVGAALWNKAKQSFWGWVRKNVAYEPQHAQAVQAQVKTYTGIFRGYNQYENFPRDWFFTLSGSGFTTKVPVHPTNLFSGVQPGSFVEIDTEVIAGSAVELVRRVRIDETA